MKKYNVIVIDTETTGLSKDFDEVVEISVISETGEVLLDTLVQPVLKKSWPEAESIHGISPAMIEEAQVPTLAELMPLIMRLCEDSKEVTAFNLAYDKAFLMRAAKQVEMDFSKDINWTCTMLPYSEIIGEKGRYGKAKWQSLAKAAEYVQHEWQGTAHRALADCQATLSVWKWLEARKARTEARRQERKARQEAQMPNLK